MLTMCLKESERDRFHNLAQSGHLQDGMLWNALMGYACATTNFRHRHRRSKAVSWTAHFQYTVSRA